MLGPKKLAFRKIVFEVKLTKEYVAQQYLRIPSKYRELIPFSPRQRIPVYFHRAGESRPTLTAAIIGPKGQRIFFRKASRESGLPNPFEMLNLKIGDQVSVIVEKDRITLIVN